MFTRQAHIPSPEQLRDELPLTKELTAIKRERDRLTMDVIAGRTDKLLLIIGPCSAHESAPVLEYVRRLGKLNERVKDKLVLVPRIYTNKPRTKGVGYKGMFSQPDPENKEDIVRGIRTIRELHIHAIEESGLSAADEMLYPENYPFLEDLLTYIAVGARSSENQMTPWAAASPSCSTPSLRRRARRSSNTATIRWRRTATSTPTPFFGAWSIPTATTSPTSTTRR